MNKKIDHTPSTLTLGLLRGNIEIRQFMRQRESVVFTIAFPLILLAIDTNISMSSRQRFFAISTRVPRDIFSYFFIKKSKFSVKYFTKRE